ncbi:membrane lipoprotein lipid attachment site-containing protein [Paraliobacillus ryukyuensis]|uniref:membrane lipoprotein lipid attachment site-containing protein n=1 Tax=Paraliobacillus ryukyuensis TaxID=200904 RepID=UPI0009A80AF1|nr:membrane lipoprotein lipid attachment site-containing protein [Paraliobacillus ryukyuensis]
MKKIVLFLVIMVVLAACSEKESAVTTTESGQDTETSQQTFTPEETGSNEGVQVEAFLPTNELNDYGETTILVLVKNATEETITINQSDFSLFDKENNVNIGIALGETVTPEELTLDAGDEDYTFTYYNIAMARESTDVTTIDKDQFELTYIGDLEIKQESIPLQANSPSKYEKQIAAAIDSRDGNEGPTPTLEEEAMIEPGLKISLYGPLDDEDVDVRVENTSNETLYYDSTQLRVFDDTYSYGIDASVTDSAFDPQMTLSPGEIVDYREIFILENPEEDDESEIAANIKGVVYAPVNEPAVYGTYNNQENSRPDDFYEYE